MQPASEELRRRLDAAPMSRAQVAAIATTSLLSALDGYDVLSVTFAAPAITREWGIDKAALGVVLSSGLAGMALGSFAIAPIADLTGRRGVVFLSLALMALGSFLSATAETVTALAGWRVVTGLGIGTCIAVINPLAAEFSNAARRPLAVSLMALGYPAGGLAGGLLAAVLLKTYGWQAVFMAGFVLAVALAPLVALLLPESPGFLAGRRGPDALPRLNALLRRCGQPPMAALPAPRRAGRGYAGVFARAQLPITARLSVVNLLAAAATYYVLSWLPQLVSDAGFDSATGSLVSAVLSLAGIGGGLLLGAVSNRAGHARITAAAAAGLGMSILALGVVPPSLPLLLTAAALCGFFLFATAAGFYGVLATGFEDRARASGSGFVIGVGRVSSAVAPLVAGLLFATGSGRPAVSIAFVAAALIAAALLVNLPARRGSAP